MGSRRRQQSTTDLERATDMAQIKFKVSGKLRASLATSVEIVSLLFIGTDSRGNWVVRDQAGLCGGLFINRSEALRFAMLENGRRPRAVIMFPGKFEFSIGGPAKAAANDSTGVAKRDQRPSAGLMISSQVNHESEALWSPHTAEHTQVPMLHGGKTCPADIDSATLIRWFMTARPQTSQLPTIRLAAITSPMLMVIRRTCLPLTACTPTPTGKSGLSLRRN